MNEQTDIIILFKDHFLKVTSLFRNDSCSKAKPYSRSFSSNCAQNGFKASRDVTCVLSSKNQKPGSRSKPKAAPAASGDHESSCLTAYCPPVSGIKVSFGLPLTLARVAQGWNSTRDLFHWFCNYQQGCNYCRKLSKKQTNRFSILSILRVFHQTFNIELSRNTVRLRLEQNLNDFC